MSLYAYISLSVILLRAEALILYRFFTYDFGNLENGYRKITERIDAEWLIKKTMWKLRGKKNRRKVVWKGEINSCMFIEKQII